MAHWGFKLCDDVRLKLAVGPYVAVGIGGRTNAYVSSSKYNIDEETGVDSTNTGMIITGLAHLKEKQ